MQNKIITLLTVFLLLSCSFPLEVDYKIAPKITLETPIKCEFSKDCFVQKYVDHGIGKSMFDYNCNVRTTDDFEGTLFRLNKTKWIEENIPVLAAYKGQISRICISPDKKDKNCPLEMMKEIGNHIIIDHENGWKTYYGHLKEGSQKIKIGQYVKTSQEIANAGIEEKEQTLALDFRSTFNSNVIDPFVGTIKFDNCHGAIAPLWSEKSFNQMKMKDAQIIIAAFSKNEPNYENIISGKKELDYMPSEIEKLYFWAEILGTKKGDREKVEIVDEKGNMLFSKVLKLEKYSDRHIIKATIDKPYEGWNSGVYTAYYTLLRNDRYIIAYQKEIRLKSN